VPPYLVSKRAYRRRCGKAGIQRPDRIDLLKTVLHNFHSLAAGWALLVRALAAEPGTLLGERVLTADSWSSTSRKPKKTRAKSEIRAQKSAAARNEVVAMSADMDFIAPPRPQQQAAPAVDIWKKAASMTRNDERRK
jgi:hypothetical protein